RNGLLSAPTNTDWQRNVSVCLERLASVFASTGDREGALKQHQESLGIRRTLAQSDPANVQWQRDVTISLNKLGDILASTGDLEGALKRYQEALGIARTLAQSDPAN